MLIDNFFAFEKTVTNVNVLHDLIQHEFIVWLPGKNPDFSKNLDSQISIQYAIWKKWFFELHTPQKEKIQNSDC